MSEGEQIFGELAAAYFVYGSAALALVGAVVGIRVALHWLKDFSERASALDAREGREDWMD